MKHRFARLLAASLLAGATASIPVRAADAAPADDAAIHFDILRFDIVGNTLLPPQQVEQIVAPFAGKQRDFGYVQRALEALEAAYHARGYSVVTVALPEQELNQGVVRLNVVQTRIGRIKVSNNGYFDEANIRRSMPDLRVGQTPNLNQVSADLRLANENPAKKINMKLQSGELDDEVDATLDVTDQRAWSGMVNVDNTGTAQTGKTHVGVVLQNANLWGRDHVATLQYTTSAEEPGRVKVYGAGYHVPLYQRGDSMDFYASYSNVDSGTVAAGVFNLAVSGKGAVYGARYNHVLNRQGKLESRLSYGLDVKAFKNSVQLLGQQLGNDVTVHPVSLTYTASLPLASGEASGSVILLHNISGFSNGGSANFTAARSGARGDYSILRVGGSLTRALASDWQLRAIFNGQYSADALIPGEQFGAGGASSVRGFIEREISNDKGASLNLEAYTPNLCAGRTDWNCRLLAFADNAYVAHNHALPDELRHTSIGSAGLGLRFLLSTYVNLQLDYGHVLRAGATGRDGANRLHLRLGLAY